MKTLLAATALLAMATSAFATQTIVKPETVQLGPYTVEVTKYASSEDADPFIMTSYVVTGKELKGLAATGSTPKDALSDYTDLLQHKGFKNVPDITNAQLPVACGNVDSYKAATGDITLKEFPGLTFHQPKSFSDGNAVEGDSGPYYLRLEFLDTPDPAVKLVLSLDYSCDLAPQGD